MAAIAALWLQPLSKRSMSVLHQLSIAVDAWLSFLRAAGVLEWYSLESFSRNFVGLRLDFIVVGPEQY